MNRRILSIACAAATCAAAQAFVLTAHLPESMTGAMAVLYDNIDGTRIDSALVAGRDLRFKGTLGAPRAVSLQVDESIFSLYMSDADSVEMNFTEEIIDGGVRTWWTVDGSAAGDALKKAYAPVREAISDSVVSHSRLAIAMEALRKTQKELMARNSDNTVGASLFLSVFAEAAAKPSVAAEMRAAAAEYPELLKYEAVAALLDAPHVGGRFKDFQLTGLDGLKHRLSDVAGRGRYVLVDFWASWCAPCMRAIPELKKLCAEYGEDKLLVVGVTVNDPVANTRSAVERFGITWPCWTGTEAVVRDYDVRSVPTAVLIAPDGTVLYRGHFDKEKIARLLQ